MTFTVRRLPGQGERPTAHRPAPDDVGPVQSSASAPVRASADSPSPESRRPTIPLTGPGLTGVGPRTRSTRPGYATGEPRWSAPHPGRRSELEEPCVCGGIIVAVTPLPTDVMYAVQRHQVEPVHIAWDEARGIPLSAGQLRARAIDGDPDRSSVGGFA